MFVGIEFPKPTWHSTLTHRYHHRAPTHRPADGRRGGGRGAGGQGWSAPARFTPAPSGALVVKGSSHNTVRDVTRLSLGAVLRRPDDVSLSEGRRYEVLPPDGDGEPVSDQRVTVALSVRFLI